MIFQALPVEKPVENFANGLCGRFMRSNKILFEQICLWKTLKIGEENFSKKIFFSIFPDFSYIILLV